MRITSPLLFPRMWIRLRGESWYRWKKRRVPNDQTLEKVIAAGYNPIDANEYVKPMSPLFIDYDSLKVPAPRFPVPPSNDNTNPDWHDEVCKVLNNEAFPVEGLQQALAFTKGVRVSENLPEKILMRADSTKLTDEEDGRVQKAVQQAFIWDAYLEKLPKLKDLDNLWFVPTNQYGIPWKRRNEILMNNFIRLIETKVPTSISQTRIICPEEQFRVNISRHGEKAQFKLDAMSHIMSTNLIKPILSSAEVEDTRQLPVTDIYPFLSTANFEDCNIYKEDDHFVVKPDSVFPYIHTSVFSHHIPGSHTHIHPRWNDDRFMGTTVLYNFATALLMARRKYGPDVTGTLPEPITTQVIHLTGQDFQFSVFQLNTLDVDDLSSTTVKNNVWITDKIQLFTECKNNLGKEIFEGYNPEIFKLVMAMYLS